MSGPRRPDRPLRAAPFSGIFHPEDYGPIGTDDDTETWLRTQAAVDEWVASRRVFPNPCPGCQAGVEHGPHATGEPVPGLRDRWGDRVCHTITYSPDLRDKGGSSERQ